MQIGEGDNMTCIIGYIDKKERTMYMGGDSCVSNGHTYTLRNNPKIMKKEKMLIGAAGSCRMRDLLFYKFAPPEHPKGMGVRKYMYTLFIDGIRKQFKDGGYATVNNNVETGGFFLVAYRGYLFQIESDFQIGEPIAIDACGSGTECALGALYALNKVETNLTIQGKIKTALEAATSHIVSVKSPYKILRLGY